MTSTANVSLVSPNQTVTAALQNTHLFETVSVFLAGSLHCELGTEDVTEFSTVSVPSTWAKKTVNIADNLPELMTSTTDKNVKMAPLTCDLFLIIIIVAGREQVTENQSWDIHLLVLVLHHGYSFTIIPDRNGVGLTDGGTTKGRMCYIGYMNRMGTHTHEMCSCVGPGVEPQYFCY